MAGDDLESWIEKQLEEGFKVDEIREALLEEGLGPGKIDRAIKTVKTGGGSTGTNRQERNLRQGNNRGQTSQNPGESPRNASQRPGSQEQRDHSEQGSSPGGNFPPKDVEYAGLGKRIVAYIIDTLWIFFGIAAPVMVLSVVSIFVLPSEIGGMIVDILAVLARLIGVTAMFGYFIYFEAKGGRTPGKKMMDIRVISESGREIGYQEAAIRNILRVIDGLFVYVVGIAVITMTDHAQRIGDLAADTVVVKE